ncbi:hypothetical protein [Rubrivirga marina]|uniref:Fibronectin type-III domain-containing protein n=1 Tax=Rubrivirga marina TaxID=1196024 RepID=A0A271J6P4_9BACT|nr:hypothetical protein [Rubrivirga marina]PAP78319.1 hypothetical protein BSZ37_18775 [Rubrivirga marina]
MPLAPTARRAARLTGLLLFALALSAPAAHAQFQTKWVAGGSFHNWYASSGSEIEVGLVNEQQYGWRWPGVYDFTDMQAAKGLWIGARNVTDEFGVSYPVRVAHVGPRVPGTGEVFPTEFELVSKYPLTVVTVDGDQSFASASMVVDRVDPDMAPDFMLINRFNTILGLTVERRVMQFSQEFHDNYHVIEYVLTNTGNVDGDAEVELPNQTLEDVIAYFQYRMAISAQTRYVMGNPTGWGKNTMNDARGDGTRVDPEDEQFRAQFAWHGFFPGRSVSYDNIGGSIQQEAINVAPADTVGRLGAHAFAGVVTLHADASASDDSDDPGQPATTNWIGSDDPYLSNNDAFSIGRMTTEYAVMSQGHKSPRHALAVEPSGLPGFLNPSRDPSAAEGQANSGGYSFANGYGPYTLGPGESVRFVVAEGADGLSREAATAIGRQFKESGNSSSAPLTYAGETMTKNEWVFTSRDSLFQTFRRAIANYQAGYDIPTPPAPPRTFDVAGGGDRITLAWEPNADGPSPDRWEVYRTQARRDSAYTLIATLDPGVTSYDDTTPVRGVNYFYYLQAVRDGAANDGSGMTPAGRDLRSSRYATQTYDGATLKRQQGEALEDIRVVPNPYYIGASRGAGGDPALRFPDRNDKLAFFNIPGVCRIDIYTELGELVDTIEHTDGSGDEFWDHTTSSRQVVASGLYIAVITVTEDVLDLATGEVLFEAGEQAVRKFVIIR